MESGLILKLAVLIAFVLLALIFAIWSHAIYVTRKNYQNQLANTLKSITHDLRASYGKTYSAQEIQTILLNVLPNRPCRGSFFFQKWRRGGLFYAESGDVQDG